MENIKTVKINDSLFINELSIKLPKEQTKGQTKEKQVTTVTSKHQYIIIDRSGSMYCDLKHVTNALKEYVKTLPENSTVSLGYFSSTGEYNLTVPYTLQKEIDGTVKTIDTYNRALGLTNFIEVLEKVNSDTVTSNRQGSLFFFTDGCHNQGGSFSRVLDVLQELKKHLEVAVFVGCGYIDRENMAKMAEVTEGSFVHLKDFSNFRETLDNFNETVEELSPSVEITLPENAGNIVSVLGKNIIKYIKSENNTIKYKVSNKNKQKIYFTSTQPIFTVKGISDKDEILARSLIYSLVQSNNVPDALEILNVIGDKYIIKRLFNTFTEDEYAVIEEEILKTIFNSKRRYKEGKVTNFLPDPNAFCVLDVLDTLINDDKAKIHLNDPDFKYKRTSRKQEQTDGSSLIYPEDISAFVSNITFHEERLNVSLNVNYSAKVPLILEQFKNTNVTKDMLELHKLKETTELLVNVIRNYNIITDGKLQTQQLVLSRLSKNAVTKLAEYLTLRDDNKYVLNLTTLPLINKSYLKTTYAKEIANKYWKQFILGYEASVLKYFIKQNTDIVKADISEDYKTFLQECFYIKNGMYQPPKTQAEASDVYKAYEFKVSFKGFSKCSVPSVVKKVLEGKKITERESIVAYFYNLYKNSTTSNLEEKLTEVQDRVKQIRNEVQTAKFSIMLINRGKMDEFTSRENMSITICSKDYISIDNISDVVVNFNIDEKEIEV